MTILAYACSSFLEVQNGSGTYLFSGVGNREYARIRAMLRRGAIGSAWQTLKKYKWDKKEV